MFKFIKNLFRRKTKSVKEFVEVVKRKGYKKILVKLHRYANGSIASIGLADSRYILEFTATMLCSREIVYRECLFEQFGSKHGLADAVNRRNATIKFLLLGDQKTQELRKKLPGVSVDLIGPNDQPMDDAIRTRLYRDAAACGVSV